MTYVRKFSSTPDPTTSGRLGAARSPLRARACAGRLDDGRLVDVALPAF